VQPACQVVFLPDIKLEKVRVVGHVIIIVEADGQKTRLTTQIFRNCRAFSITGRANSTALHSVRVALHGLIEPSERRAVDGIIPLN
jgi:hypothetical protein